MSEFHKNRSQEEKPGLQINIYCSNLTSIDKSHRKHDEMVDGEQKCGVIIQDTGLFLIFRVIYAY